MRAMMRNPCRNRSSWSGVYATVVPFGDARAPFARLFPLALLMTILQVGVYGYASLHDLSLAQLRVLNVQSAAPGE